MFAVRQSIDRWCETCLHLRRESEERVLPAGERENRDWAGLAGLACLLPGHAALWIRVLVAPPRVSLSVCARQEISRGRISQPSQGVGEAGHWSRWSCLSAVECFVLGGGPPGTGLDWLRPRRHAAVECGRDLGEARSEARRGKARPDNLRQEETRLFLVVPLWRWHYARGESRRGLASWRGERILARASKGGLDWTRLDSLSLAFEAGRIDSLAAVTPSFTGGTHQTSSLDFVTPPPDLVLLQGFASIEYLLADHLFVDRSRKSKKVPCSNTSDSHTVSSPEQPRRTAQHSARL